MLFSDYRFTVLAFLLSLGSSVLFFSYSTQAKSAHQAFILKCGVFIPLAILAHIALSWSLNLLNISSGMDAYILHVAVAKSGSPYSSPIHDQTPTLYAFHRFIMGVAGDNSLAQLKATISWGNCISLAVMIICLALYAAKSMKIKSVSLLTTLSCLCVCVASLPLVARNIEVKNANIWLAGPVALYLLTAQLSEHRWKQFLGGMALGVAFMMKPCFPIVLIFLFFSALRTGWSGRNSFALAGVFAAGLMGFLGSLLAPGIDIGTYYEFLFEALPGIYQEPKFHYNMAPENLSLLKYVSLEAVPFTSSAVLGIFSISAFFDSRKNESSLPWFFVTLLFSPILWSMHLMAVFPALLILVMETKANLRQLVYCAAVVTAIIFACIFRNAVVLNACLIFVWAAEIIPCLLEPGGKYDSYLQIPIIPAEE